MRALGKRSEGAATDSFTQGDDDGRPMNCPEPVVASGWRRDYQGRWQAVDACAEHASQLEQAPWAKE
jgi:hypothetical protein